MDIFRLGTILFPHMLQIWARNKYQVQIADDLIGVTYHSTTARTTHHKVQFEDLMLMDGIVELLLMAICDIHEVMLAQWCDLTQDSRWHIGLFLFNINLGDTAVFHTLKLAEGGGATEAVAARGDAVVIEEI